jgi:hypothetical protein
MYQDCHRVSQTELLGLIFVVRYQQARYNIIRTNKRHHHLGADGHVSCSINDSQQQQDTIDEGREPDSQANYL